jgi:hypothetical protein
LAYGVTAKVNPGAGAVFDGVHTVIFSGGAGGLLELCLYFFQGEQSSPPEDFAAGQGACAAFWPRYWQEGAAVEFAAPQRELERRVVLSQYLVAIQSRGPLPPAETGLTLNSWYGKFHMEMYFWHAAHFPLWNRRRELERGLAWYAKMLPQARALAQSQGYAGARWPKMCGPAGLDAPSPIGPLLLWQQPHPILLAELCRRQNPDPAFLRQYRDVVVESAAFMCALAHWDGGRYVLGPPYIPCQERFDPATVLNAGFEVEYFRWGLRAANAWLRALGEPENPAFAQVAQGLAQPLAPEGVYLAHEGCPGTYRPPFNTDHPSFAAMLGVLPGEGVDPRVMAATLDKITTDWDLSSTWGWDFPMLAMTAARLGRRRQALDLLLAPEPKNTYLPNGHNPQADNPDLPLYLPGNAALLLAVAMMAAGWDGCGGDTGEAPGGAGEAPGFPPGVVVGMEGLWRYI